mmetsp:Transcript_13831/g.56044  ORF Transcript_13831/g.56044 Transcript_13831/m.56044 type:complete len:367 (+) Transcript_13831:42-1142(+)
MVRALGLRVARRALASAAAPGGPSPSPNPLRYGGPILPALPIGFVSGAVGSAVGIGGALVAVPTTMHAYRLRQLQATSTALLLNVATCASGALVFASAGHVDPIAGCLVASGATATAGPGARLAHAMRERTQRLVFASALLALAPVIALKPVIGGAVEGAVDEGAVDEGAVDRLQSQRERARAGRGACLAKRRRLTRLTRLEDDGRATVAYDAGDEAQTRRGRRAQRERASSRRDGPAAAAAASSSSLDRVGRRRSSHGAPRPRHRRRVRDGVRARRSIARPRRVEEPGPAGLRLPQSRLEVGLGEHRGGSRVRPAGTDPVDRIPGQRPVASGDHGGEVPRPIAAAVLAQRERDAVAFGRFRSFQK